MTQSQQLATAKTAAEQPQILCTDKDLSAAEGLWAGTDVIAIDTEFVRERTYFAALGLIQISNGTTVWLVDPLNISDFGPLQNLFTNPSILKILHSPSEDLEILQQYFGCLPEPMFDTQLAAAMLGQALQISYQKLLLWQLEIEIDKGETRSNWLQRPLRKSQLHYAAMDVSYLPIVYQQLSVQLHSSGRYDWVTQDSQLQLFKARQEADIDSLYLKFTDAWRLDDRQLRTLQKLCRWREETAIKNDLPRSFILKDKELSQIARCLPDSISSLNQCAELHPKSLRLYGEKILHIITTLSHKQADSEPVTSPLMPLSSTEKACLKEVKEAVNNIAAAHDLDPASLASRRELEALIRQRPLNNLPAKFRGWRKSLLDAEITLINQLTRA